MSKKSFLDSIQSPSPCSKNWNEMSGDEKARFCNSCEKDVHNISAMTRKEARKFVAQNSGKACVRFERLGNGKVLTVDTKPHKTRRASRIAAGVFSAALTISTVANAQNVETPKPQKDSTTQTQKAAKTSQISFPIYDPSGEVIPNAEVKLTNIKTSQESVAYADANGIANFALIPRGRYEIEISANGFRSYKQTIQIEQEIEPKTKVTLEVGTFTGIVVIETYEIPFFTIIAQENNEEISRILSQDFDVKTKNTSKQTALHIAVEHLNLEAVRILLDANANVNTKDKYNRTPLLMIDENIEENTAEIVRLLIQKGADVNVQTKSEKSSVLMFACDDNNLEIVKMLLEAGANPNLKDEDGETALQKTDSEEIKQLLKQYGAKE